MKSSLSFAAPIVCLLVVLSLLGAVFAPFAQGQVSFFAPPTYTGRGVPFLADFNGDGKTDILTGDGTLNLGNGDGTFTAGTPVTGGALAVGDFNGDGKADVLQQGTGTLLVLLGNGDGTFQPPISTNSGASLTALAAADLNGDGKADVVGVFNSALVVYLSKGDGTFFSGVSYNLGTNSGGLITFGDFNADGHTDVAVLSTATDGSGQVVVLLGNGDGTFQAARTSASVFFWGSAVAGDFNGDGKLDLVVSGNPSGSGPGSVSLQLGNGDGTFQAPTTIVPYAPAGMAAADLNADGKIDLAIITKPSGGANSVGILEIYLGNGDGTFSGTHSYRPSGAGPGGLGLIIGDFNLDNHLDVAVSGDILLGNGDGTFQGWSAVYIGPWLPAIGDFDGDGFPDAAVLGSDSNNGFQVNILMNDGTGALSVAHTYSLPKSKTVIAIAAADVNGDGKLDLLATGTTYPAGGLLIVLLGNGDGTFGAPAAYSYSNTIDFGNILVADFNNDRTPDIAVQVLDKTVAILLGNGDGTFGSPVEYFDGQGSYRDLGSLVSADFNGDGNLDLAVGGQVGLAILLGNGDGTFQAANFPVTSSGFAPIHAGDLNGDGKTDLVGPGQVLLSNGDGTFRSLTEDITEVLADIDGDGKLDLVGIYDGSGNFPPRYEGVVLGNGDGTFGPIVSTLVSWGGGLTWEPPSFQMAADMNGDGKPDLIFGDNHASDIFVVLNTTPPVPGATFSPTSVNFSTQTVGTSSSPVPVTLTNTGKAALTVTGVSIGGANASAFSQKNNCTTLQPKATCTINVSFAPTSGGAAGANLIVKDNARGGSQQIALAGTGVEPFSIGPASGSQTSATVTAGNSAKFSLAISSTSWSGTVNLSCNITPAVTPAPTCTVPGSVAVTAGTDAPVSVTVATTAPGTAGFMSSANFPPGATLVMWTMVLFTSGLLFVGSRRRLPSLAAPVIVLAFVAMAGCGGGGGSSSHPTPGTPAGTYTATVKATSGLASTSTALTVIVQ